MRIQLWKDLLRGDQPLCSPFLGLFIIVTAKNSTISSIFRFTNPFSWNLNFRHNLSDFEIGYLKRLMSSLSFCTYPLLFLMRELSPYLSQVYLQ